MVGMNKMAIAGALGVAVLGIGAVVASPLNSEASPSISPTSVLLQEADGQEGEHGRMHSQRGHGERRAEVRAEIAAALGVSVEDYTVAVEAVKESIEKPEPPLSSEQRLALRDQVSAALAAELGVTQAAVEAAHDQVFAARLQEKVDEGKISAEEAAEISAARDDGTLGELMRERRAERIGERLDGAVEAGRITPEQRDALQAELDEGDREGFRELMKQIREESGTFSPRGFQRGEGGFPRGNGGGTTF